MAVGIVPGAFRAVSAAGMYVVTHIAGKTVTRVMGQVDSVIASQPDQR